MKENNKISVVDYTINEILRLGFNDPADFKFILSVLKKYSLDVADISLSSLETNMAKLETNMAKLGASMVKFKTDDLLENLRCRVECSEQEVYKAKKLGFSKIVINISLDPFASIHDKLKLTEHVLQTVCSNNQEIYL